MKDNEEMKTAKYEELKSCSENIRKVLDIGYSDSLIAKVKEKLEELEAKPNVTDSDIQEMNKLRATIDGYAGIKTAYVIQEARGILEGFFSDDKHEEFLKVMETGEEKFRKATVENLKMIFVFSFSMLYDCDINPVSLLKEVYAEELLKLEDLAREAPQVGRLSP